MIKLIALKPKVCEKLTRLAKTCSSNKNRTSNKNGVSNKTRNSYKKLVLSHLDKQMQEILNSELTGTGNEQNETI